MRFGFALPQVGEAVGPEALVTVQTSRGVGLRQPLGS
jgi:hypothetical protein